MSWADFRADSDSEVHFASEHAVDFDVSTRRVVKVTIPPKFGLTPQVLSHRNVNLRDDPEIPEFRQAIEFVDGTPREYLRRWMAANKMFRDDIRLASVIRWADGLVSFCITQSHYNGEPASVREIDQYFVDAGWLRVQDPAGQRQIFFNYAFGVFAIDAMPRNWGFLRKFLSLD